MPSKPPVSIPPENSLLRIAPEFDRLLRKTCEAIIRDARDGRATPAAADWLLENYSFLRTQIREVRESMPRGYFRRLPRFSGSRAPRIFIACDELISQAGELDADKLLSFFEHWQQRSVLMLSELWAIRPMLKLGLLRKLASVIESGPLESDPNEAQVRAAITGLHALEEVIWPDLVESLCVIDRMLHGDPAGAYERMDFETRDRYRRTVEDIARRSRYTEQEVAGLAIELAREANVHVGRFLVTPDVRELRRAARSRNTVRGALWNLIRTAPLGLYLGAAAVLTAAALGAIQTLLGPLPVWFLALLFLPATQSALAIVNLVVSWMVTPRLLPRMDFRDGIPDDARTFVVVPTLLLNHAGIERLVANLEIYYLANRDRNLLFALLTDFPDAASEQTDNDGLLEVCAAGIRDLNRRYRENGAAPFFLFHRRREWTESEKAWMGRERKRGKLEDFNHLLLGRGNAFSFTVGDNARLPGVRYIITLDSDTQLPRDTAWKLVGTMAHPLNQPVFDERSGLVESGYALLQPRISISMESASRSRLASIYSGQTGFDPYTKAVSDVYQDLFGRATFTGKGIYDVAAFDRATAGRFPDNTLLSHDLIEGEHVRAGLITDLEMIDDYPAKYQAFSKRKHRWVRGDWQIAMWLLPRVPDAAWKWFRNPLPLTSRWKIADNIRRSLVEPAYFLALFCGWLFLAGSSVAATLAVLGLLILPVYAELAVSLLRLPPLRFLRAWGWTRLSDFSRAHLDAALTVIFLPTQALLMADGVARTLYRRVLSKRNLLEWESMAQSEMAGGSDFQFSALASPSAVRRLAASLNLPERCIAASTSIALLMWVWLLQNPEAAHALNFGIVFAWLGSPLVMMWLNGGAHSAPAKHEDYEFLRGVALSTWRYFNDHGGAEENWLVPDNVQEDPPAVAYRTSPTNLGLQLNALVAAHEFGYLSHQQFCDRVARVHATLGRMERHRGHFFNWYDTHSLGTLNPRFVSTVDSGNLAASLIVMRQGCLAVLNQPLARANVLEGLMDHFVRLRDSIPVPARTSSIVRIFESLRRQLSAQPDDLFFWEGVLSELRSLAHQLCDHVDWSAGRLETVAAEQAVQVRFWMNEFLARVDGALSGLGDLAPWLCPPFETELRLSFSNPQLAGLMEHVRSIPTVSQMGSRYDAIENEIERLGTQDSRIHRSTLEALQGLRGALAGARKNWQTLRSSLEAESSNAARLFEEMNFRFLFDQKRKLFHIGWNDEKRQLEPSFYDLLASEARTGVFVAIAKGDAPREAWFHLGRKLTYYRGHRTLISWSGTMFEYLMPTLFMQTWGSTLLGESLRSVVRIQRLYARERRVPWGISESAHSARDGALNYQYRAFGVPVCGATRMLPDDLVIAPYASVLSLMIDPRAAAENLRQMAARGWLASYGFYEAIDFRRGARGHRGAEVIRAFMAHHQGMSFLALCNTLLGNTIQKLFHADPAVVATELLLQERMPVMADVTEPEEPLTPQIEPANDMGSAFTQPLAE